MRFRQRKIRETEDDNSRADAPRKPHGFRSSIRRLLPGATAARKALPGSSGSSSVMVVGSDAPDATRESAEPDEEPREESPVPPKPDEELSLWDRAYEKLREENDKLVEGYEKLLSKELGIQAAGTEGVSDSENSISKSDPRRRREQLASMTERGLDRAEKEKDKSSYRVANRKFNVQDQAAAVVGIVQWAKPLIDEAVKASPEASLAWSGASLLLSLLARPSEAEKACRDGFTYTVSRAKFYGALEPRMFPVATSQDVRQSLRDTVTELYQRILEFHVSAVLRFFRPLWSNVGRDLAQPGVWDDMKSAIQKVEARLDDDLRRTGDTVALQHLGGIEKSAAESREALGNLLAVGEQQVRIGQEGVEVARGIWDELRKRHPLPTEGRATHDSAENEGLPLCQDNTRAGVLREMHAWVDGNNAGSSLLWVCGPAGTGKSTVSRTFARRLASTGQLAGSFFFDAGRAYRSTATLLFPTLAAQLCATVPQFGEQLGRSLDALGPAAHAEIADKGLREQFQRLVLDPFLMLPGSVSGTWVVLIDALDECRDKDGDVRLCELLSRLHDANTTRLREHGDQTAQLRVLLTSRLTPELVHKFEDIPSTHYRRLLLHSDFSEETRSDVAAFLAVQFREIRREFKIHEDPWPRPEQMDRLVETSTTPSPLFIYAATICRFVRKSRRRNPRDQLKTWLQQSGRMEHQVHDLYTQILDQVLYGPDEDGNPDPIDEKGEQLVRQILGAIVLLQTPLPARQLARLLGLDADDVVRWIENFHAVLNSPGDDDSPIEIMHASFPDFLLREQAGPGLRINGPEMHYQLALRCLQLMHDVLVRDLCNLGDPCGPVDEDIKRLAEDKLGAAGQYACLFWIHHLVSCEAHRQEDLKDIVLKFLNTKFLPWLESLSLLGRFLEAIRPMRDLTTKRSISDAHYSQFLSDALKFILGNRIVIERAPLQAYGSALLFCPTESLVRASAGRVDEHKLQRDIRTARGIRPRYDPLLLTLAPPGPLVHTTIDQKGATIATSLKDGSVWIWDVHTGDQKQLLYPDNGGDEPDDLNISPDGTTVAVTFSRRQNIDLWDVATGSKTGTIRTPEFPPFYRQLTRFVPGCSMMAVLCERRFLFYDTPSSSLAYDSSADLDGDGFIVNSGPRDCVCVSPDGRRMAVLLYHYHDASDCGRIGLWDTRHPIRMTQTLTTEDGIYSIAFVSGSTTLAAVLENSSVVLWDTNTGAVQAQTRIPDVITGVLSLSFLSPDGALLAVPNPPYNEVTIWRLADNSVRSFRTAAYASVPYFVPDPDKTILAVCIIEPCIVQLWVVSDLTPQRLGSPERLLIQGRSIPQAAPAPDEAAGADSSSAREEDGIEADSSSANEEDEIEGPLTELEAPRPPRRLQNIDDALLRVSTRETARESPDNVVSNVIFSADGTFFVSLAEDGTVQAWDCARGTLAHKLSFGSWIKVAALSPSGTLAWPDPDGDIVWLWDVRHFLRRGENGSDDSSEPLDCHATCWEFVPTPPRPSRLAPLPAGVAFSADGALLACAAFGGSISIWDVASRKVLAVLSTPSMNIVFFLAFSSTNANTLASVASNGTMAIWDIATRTITYRRRIPSLHATAFAFSPDGSLLAVAEGSTVFLVRVGPSSSSAAAIPASIAYSPRSTPATSPILTTFRIRTRIMALAFSPDSRHLAAGLRNFCIRSLLSRRRSPSQHSNRSIYSGRSCSIYSDSASSRSDDNDGGGSGSDGNSHDNNHSSGNGDNEGDGNGSSDGDCDDDGNRGPPNLQLHVDLPWVVYRGVRVLLLPQDLDVQCWASWDNRLALGHLSGRVTFIELEKPRPGD